MGFFRSQRNASRREIQSSVPRGDIQPIEPGEFRYAQSDRIHLRYRSALSGGWNVHQYIYNVPASSIWIEAALVKCWHAPSNHADGAHRQNLYKTIIGATKVDQLDSNLSSPDCVIPAELRARLDKAGALDTSTQLYI